MQRLLLISVLVLFAGSPALAERFSDYPPMRTKDDAPARDDADMAPFRKVEVKLKGRVARIEKELPQDERVNREYLDKIKKADAIVINNFSRFQVIVGESRLRKLDRDFKKDFEELRCVFQRREG